MKAILKETKQIINIEENMELDACKYINIDTNEKLYEDEIEIIKD